MFLEVSKTSKPNFGEISLSQLLNALVLFVLLYLMCLIYFLKTSTLIPSTNYMFYENLNNFL